MTQKQNKYDEIILDAVRQINEKFGSQAEFAKILGESEQNLSNKLRRMSDKFIVQLKKHGVVVRKSQNSNVNSYNSIEGINSNLVELLKENFAASKETIDYLREANAKMLEELTRQNIIIEKLAKNK